MTSRLELPDKLRTSRNQLSTTVLVGILIALTSFGYFSHYCTDMLFSSDAADYVRVGKNGFAESYLDTGSAGLWGSLRIIRRHPEARIHFYDFLEQQDDAAPKRHWHVAPGLYGAAIASQFGADNRTYRLMMAVAGAAAIAAVFIGLRLASVHLLLALATAVLAALSPAVVYASSTVAPHAPFLAALVASGFAFAQYLEHRKRAWGVATGVALGFAVAACELSVVIFAAFALLLAWRAIRAGIKSTLDLLAVPAAALLATMTLLWPGGIFRGGYVLSYGAWCFNALFRRAKDFGEAASLGVVLTRGAQGSHIVLLLFVAIVIGVLILELSGRSNIHIQVFSWLVLGFFAQGMLNRFKNPTYVSHFVVLTWVLLALISQQWITQAKARAHFAALAAVSGVYLLLAIPASGWPAASARAGEEEQMHSDRVREVLALATKTIPPGATVLANYDYDIWGLYLPENVVKHSMNASNLDPRPWVKMPEDYWIIADPRWLSPEWRDRLGALSPSISAGGFVVTHVSERN